LSPAGFVGRKTVFVANSRFVAAILPVGRQR